MLTLMVRRSFTPSYTAILRWAGTQMLHRRDATYLSAGAGPGQPPQWNYLGQETAAIRRLTEIFHRSSDSDTSYDPA